VFPGKSGQFTLYEDAGNSIRYQEGEYARTLLRMSWEQGKPLMLTIDPVQGQYPGMLKSRSYEIRIPGILPSSQIRCNGATIARREKPEQNGWWYDGETAELRVRIGPFDVNGSVHVSLEGVRLLASGIDDLRGKIARFKRVMPLLNNLWPEEWSPESLVQAAQVGHRLSLWPERATSELDALQKQLPQIQKEIEALTIPASVKEKALQHLRQQ
jgi:hypothetical protein